MSISKQSFSNLYNDNKVKLVGLKASKSEVDENYKYYVALADFCNGDGELIFKPDGKQSISWEFAPKTSLGPSIPE